MTKGDKIINREVYGIFNDSFPPILDGVTLTVENYARWLGEQGLNPCVVTPRNPVKIEKPYQVLRYFSLPIASRRPYRYGYPRLDPFIWWKLRNTNFRILHAHCPFSSGRLAVYAKRVHDVPLIGTFHSKYKTDLEHSFRNAPFMVDIIMKRILNFFNQCDEVWIPQAKVEATVREYGYHGRLTVVENGNDFADLVGSDVVSFKRDCRERLAIPPQKLVLLFVGQHIWEKGIGIIFEALVRLRGKVDFEMHFIGTGYAADTLRQRVEAAGLKGRVTLHGNITDRRELLGYYGAADLFLFPSFYDNAPLVVREAAAAATPALIPVGSTASEVIRDGYNGFLTHRNSESYMRLIYDLSKNREAIEKAGDGARQSLVRSWRSVVSEVRGRYEDILRHYSFFRNKTFAFNVPT